jgi:ankyrin repeat protein
LDCGADVNARCSEGSTPLHFACEHGNSDTVVNYLIDKGAEVGAENVYGETGLHFASAMGKCSLVELLVQHGANMDVADKDGMTALHFAVLFGYVNVVQYMLGSKTSNATTASNKECTKTTEPSKCSEGRLDASEKEIEDDDEENYSVENVQEYPSYNEVMVALQVACGFSREYSKRLVYRDCNDDDSDEESTCTNSTGTNIDVMTAIQMSIVFNRSDIVRDLIHKYA